MAGFKVITEVVDPYVTAFSYLNAGDVQVDVLCIWLTARSNEKVRSFN